MKNLVFSLILILQICLPEILEAREINSLEDLRYLALENSLEYKKALLEVELAAGSIESPVNLDDTTFAADRTYNGESEEWNSSVTMDLPLLDQLSLNTTLTDDHSIQGGFQFTPLNHSDDRKQLKIALQKARAFARETAVSVENIALSTGLNWMIQTRLLKNQDELVSVKESIYSDEKIRYQAGESSLDDVREALLDWTEARSSLGELQNQVREAESELITAFGVAPEDIVIPLLERTSLEMELDRIQETLLPERTEFSSRYEILSAQLEVQSGKAELTDTWLFDPDLTMNTMVDLNDQELEWEVSLSFSFSPSDWQASRRRDLRAELDLLEQEAQQIAMQNRLSLQQALTALENAARGSEMARIERDQAEELNVEAEFLYDLGEYSEAEREDALVSYQAAEISLFSALSEEYLAWRELLLYMPGE